MFVHQSRRFSARVELLEDRTVPTTAYLLGVNQESLRVDGTNGNDTIQITTTSSTITISGVSKRYPRARITDLVVSGVG